MYMDFVQTEIDFLFQGAAPSSALFYSAISLFDGEFKKSCCQFVDYVSCVSCNSSDCSYRLVFGKQLSADYVIVKKHQKPSLPFVFKIRDIDSTSCVITIGIVLMGNTISLVSSFFNVFLKSVNNAMISMNVVCRYDVKFFTVEYSGDRVEIQDLNLISDALVVLSTTQVLQNTICSDHIRVRILSPLKLVDSGVAAARFDFSLFFRSQLRRCSSLCAYYGNGVGDYEFKSLATSSEYVDILENNIRYRQPEWSNLSRFKGLVGSCECSGLMETIAPLLILGSYFNAGKSASAGFGSYIIENV